MTNIFIANLDWEITSEDLQATFSAFGEVHLAHVVFDAKTKKSKGFGYVEMVSAEEAINAIQALNGFEVNGRKLDVKIASPKANRPKKDPNEQPQRKPFNKQGGFGGGQKRFNNGPRQGGGGYNSGGGGGYRSNNSGGGYNSGGGGGYRSNNSEGGGGGYRSNNSGGGYNSGGGGGYRSNNEGGGYKGGGGGYRSNEGGGYNSGSGSSYGNDRPPRPRKRFDDETNKSEDK
jgi:RNA recognition motif-containing protein